MPTLEIIHLTEKSPSPSMTFASFIEGESNRLARAMALAASDNPDNTALLYIYGGRGVGKSHLLSALSNELKGRGIKVLFARAGDGKVMSIDEGVPPEVILVDDLPFSDDNLAQTLANLAALGKMLVLTGRVRPEELPESPLSRMIKEKGRCADIQLPEEELRIAILKARAEGEGFHLPDEAARFIAGHIRGNLHSLIGGLHRVRAVSSLSGQEISRFSAIQALKDYIWSD